MTLRGSIRVCACGLAGRFRTLRRSIGELRHETKWWCAGSKGNPADQRENYPFRSARKRPLRWGHIHRQFCLMKLTAGVQRDRCKPIGNAVTRHTAWQERVAHDTRAMGKRWLKVTGSCRCESVPLLAA